MRDEWNVYDAYDAASWIIGFVMLPVSFAWRCIKQITYMLTDS